MKQKTVITSDANNGISLAVIGTFEGKSADASVENANQMTLGPELWRNLFNSEEYKRYLKLGHYIGFLGHPDDVGCQDYKNACIVMTDGWLDNDNQVYAKFNLIDTPVGRIVKSFIDAGVQFGISVRGAGDVDASGEVDPDTFVFRGFDIVTFPAYDDAIPKFTEIAASNDVDKQVKYKSICKALKNNLSEVTSSTAIEVLQHTVGKNSKEYQQLELRKSVLASGTLDISNQKLEGMTQLYLAAIKANKTLTETVETLKSRYSSLQQKTLQVTKKSKRAEQIMSSQLDKLQSDLDTSNRKYRSLLVANKRMKSELADVTASKDDVFQICDDLRLNHGKLQSELNSIKATNLKYKQRVNESASEIQKQSETISNLETKLRETVSSASNIQMEASNLDAKVKRLQSELTASTKLLEEYQEAYAELYASVIGVHLDSITVNASTSVKELKAKITNGTSTSNIPVAPMVAEPIDVTDDFDGVDDDSLITV